MVPTLHLSLLTSGASCIYNVDNSTMNNEFKCARKKLWINSEILMTQTLRQDGRYAGQDFKPGPPEYEVGMLTTRHED